MSQFTTNKHQNSAELNIVKSALECRFLNFEGLIVPVTFLRVDK